MSFTVGDVCHAIESWAPAGLAYEWDRSGLAIGAPGAKISRVLVCLSVTEEARKAAMKAGAEMIVSHHPLIWEPLKALRTDDPNTRLCLALAQGGIACYSAHTNLDVVPGGVNEVLAANLGLGDLRPLFSVAHANQVKLVTFVPEAHLAAVRDAVCGAGAGEIGEYSHCTFSAPGTGTFKPSGRANPFSGERGKLKEEAECRFETLVPKGRLSAVLDALLTAHPYEEVAYDLFSGESRDPAVSLGLRGVLPKSMRLDRFAAHVCRCLGLKHVRSVGASAKRVRQVAVLGGAGGSRSASVPRDVDVYVTGDVGYHDALSALQNGLAVVDAGHGGTEKGIVPVLAARLRRELKGLKVSTYTERGCFTHHTP
jgi:dinuclear metal center YbgI/SA1388 family protein